MQVLGYSLAAASLIAMAATIDAEPLTVRASEGWVIFDPTKDGHAYRYGPSIIVNDDDTVDVVTAIFTTDEVGSYLRIAILGYESDGGTGETLLYEGLGIAANLYLTGGVATILGMDTGTGNLIGQLFGTEDDFLGSFEKAWKIDEDWGVGKYTDIQCKMKDDTIGLRLWFTIETG